jgi:exodeoxyribonuclease-5
MSHVSPGIPNEGNPISLTPEQAEALGQIAAWYRDPERKWLTLGGYAGTGKTTLMSQLSRAVGNASIVYAAPTGKAASVLRSKLQQVGIAAECSTLHSLLYRPRTNQKGEVIGWEPRNDLTEIDLVVVDEASMVSQEVWQHLLQTGLLVLAVGDHGQLPPVGTGFNLMTNPDLRLETIHRQAADNPIIAFATSVRLGQPFDPALADGTRLWFGNGRRHVEAVVSQMVRNGIGMNHAVLCHRNRTRVELNRAIRQQLGYPSDRPVQNDLVIGLRNMAVDEVTKLYNGQRGTVRELFPIEDAQVFDDRGKAHAAFAKFLVGIEFDTGDDLMRLEANRLQFGRETTYKAVEEFAKDSGITENLRHIAQLGALVDYGYALTVHKSQGSEFDDVLVVYEQSSVNRCTDPPDFARRFLYTACTRAKHRLAVVWA